MAGVLVGAGGAGVGPLSGGVGDIIDQSSAGEQDMKFPDRFAGLNKAKQERQRSMRFRDAWEGSLNAVISKWIQLKNAIRNTTQAAADAAEKAKGPRVGMIGASITGTAAQISGASQAAFLTSNIARAGVNSPQQQTNVILQGISDNIKVMGTAILKGLGFK